MDSRPARRRASEERRAPALARAIRLPQATGLFAGTVIGVAIFVQPAEVARHVASEGEFLAAWAVAAALACAGALLCCELASRFRQGGGVHRYLTEAFGPAVGFLWNWSLFWAIHSAILAAVATVFARSVRAALAGTALAERIGEAPLALAAILALTAVNVLGVRGGTRLQVALTLAKVGALLGLAALGLVLGSAAPPAPLAPVAGEGAGSPAAFVAAVFAALFTFGGWHLVTFPTDETEHPRRTLPRSIVLGFGVVVLVYAALHAAYLRLLTLPEIAASSHVAADAARLVAGDAGRLTITIVAALSALGALSGLVLVGPRSYLAAAADGAAPRWLGAVHRRWRTPHAALLLQAAWAGTLAVVGSYRALYGLALGVEWAFFGLLALAAIVLRRRANSGGRLRARFAAPGQPFLALVFLSACVALVAMRAFTNPRAALLGLLLVASGLPVYRWIARRREPRASRSVPAIPAGTS